MRVRARSSRWRRSPRAVSTIIATILLVAITVVLAAILYILITGIGKAPAKPPIGSELAVAAPTETTHGPANHWYNFSVISAGSGLTLGDVLFQLQTGSGGVIPWPAGTTFTVSNFTAHTIGTYNGATGSWSSGGSAPLTSQDTFIVYTAATSLSGDRLVIFGAGSYSGQTAVNIS
jgi:flagellin-like protein